MLICACICECVMRGVWARGKGRLWWHPPTLCPCLPPGATKAAGGTQAAKGAASMGASRTLSTAASSARSPMLGRGAPAAAGFRCAWLHSPPPIPSPALSSLRFRCACASSHPIPPCPPAPLLPALQVCMRPRLNSAPPPLSTPPHPTPCAAPLQASEDPGARPPRPGGGPGPGIRALCRCGFPQAPCSSRTGPEEVLNRDSGQGSLFPLVWGAESELTQQWRLRQLGCRTSTRATRT